MRRMLNGKVNGVLLKGQKNTEKEEKKQILIELSSYLDVFYLTSIFLTDMVEEHFCSLSAVFISFTAVCLIISPHLKWSDCDLCCTSTYVIK